MNQNDYLQHYGVMGMRWGIRRAEKALSSSKSNAKKKQKAMASLEKHRGKAEKKVASLQKSHAKLVKKKDTNTLHAEAKGRALKKRASTTRNKAYGFLVSQKRANRLLFKADKLDARAEVLLERSNKVKADINKNEKLQEIFNTGISNIDRNLVSKGKMAAGVK